jgi:tellurium resistance protein TerD
VGVSLSKGGNVSLTKAAPNLTAVIVGLGWDVRTTTGTDFDLDASALLTNAEGKVATDGNFVFFNNLKSADGSVEHTGDNLTGEGEGDDEQIKVNLASVPADVEKIVFPVSIYEAEGRQPRTQFINQRALSRCRTRRSPRQSQAADALIGHDHPQSHTPRRTVGAKSH